jgi:hypothetical protein
VYAKEEDPRIQSSRPSWAAASGKLLAIKGLRSSKLKRQPFSPRLPQQPFNEKGGRETYSLRQLMAVSHMNYEHTTPVARYRRCNDLPMLDFVGENQLLTVVRFGAAEPMRRAVAAVTAVPSTAHKPPPDKT